ncbi:RWD domain-containing protein 1-like [Haliotis rubra]|uniref:RWD domain-containing protein 1-like n=1 Tax=Haliotis rubra TaxID=36100 RepID=UPI001EE5734A|nr:RWD domain-containing protein 1-like [Haliotis rubra]
MTDYKEEQKNEIEALEAIYPEELTIESTDPYVFSLAVASQDTNDTDEAFACACLVQFTYVENYPDEPPLMEIIDPENLDDADVESLTQYLNEQAQENIGMAMVFTLVSALQERLTTNVEDAQRKVVEDKEREQRVLEEIERKRFEGTRVTVESFMSWKQKFDAEMAELKKSKTDVEVTSKKLTGYELFMRDSSMNDSDVQFLQSADADTVEVDESLFQDMDDLDLDEDVG